MKVDVKNLTIHIPENNLICNTSENVSCFLKTQTAASEKLEASKVA